MQKKRQPNPLGKQDPELFIKTWQTSDSKLEVARKLKVHVNDVSKFAGLFRTKGVNLKKMRKDYFGFDWMKLRKLAEDYVTLVEKKEINHHVKVRV